MITYDDISIWLLCFALGMIVERILDRIELSKKQKDK